MAAGWGSCWSVQGTRSWLRGQLGQHPRTWGLRATSRARAPAAHRPHTGRGRGSSRSRCPAWPAAAQRRRRTPADGGGPASGREARRVQASTPPRWPGGGEQAAAPEGRRGRVWRACGRPHPLPRRPEGPTAVAHHAHGVDGQRPHLVRGGGREAEVRTAGMVGGTPAESTLSQRRARPATCGARPGECSPVRHP